MKPNNPRLMKKLLKQKYFIGAGAFLAVAVATIPFFSGAVILQEGVLYAPSSNSSKYSTNDPQPALISGIPESMDGCQVVGSDGVMDERFGIFRNGKCYFKLME